MRVLPYVLLAALAISLPSCVPGQKLAVAKAVVTVRATAPADRKAEIRRQLAALCPQPLPPASLNRLADFLEKYISDPLAFGVAGDLDRMDKETAICRRGPK